MSDIVEFLRARLDEDERTAVALQEAYERDEVRPHARLVNYGALVVPACVLREVEAKRRIVDEHATVDPCDAHDGATLETVTCDTLLALASVYSDHPDYDPAWA